MAEQAGADGIALGAGGHEGIGGERRFGRSDYKIVAQHRAEQVLVAGRGLPNQMGNYRTEEEPPEFEGAIEFGERDGFDAIAEIAEMLSRTANREQSFRRGAAKFGIFEDADTEATRLFWVNIANRDRRGLGVNGIGPGYYIEKLA